MTPSFGTPETVEWITSATSSGLTITSAIPPLFDRYATFVDVDEGATPLAEQERAVVSRLVEQGPHHWWLGYLDTGADDVVFPRARKVSMYADWPYVLVRGGPDEALGWRDTLPDLIFPDDRSWLVSMLWDDSWTCVGGPASLIELLLADPLVQARAVELGDDATPPGHTAI